MSNDAKPRLLFLRFSLPCLAPFLQRHVEEHVRCLSLKFDVTVVDDLSCDYKRLCETHQPDIVMFQTGSYVFPKHHVSNTSAYPEIPRVGFIHCDAFCPTRKLAILDMARYEVSTYFSNSLSLGDYTPSIADQLFAWPNFIDPNLHKDYGFPKVIPVLFTGSQTSFYLWRSKIDRIVSQYYPSLHSPHFGWAWHKGQFSNLNFLDGERYAQLINSSWVTPTCGTIANDVVRKHFEIPACNSCLLTQKTAALEAAGYVDGVNCVFADETNVLDKLEWLFQNPDELVRITKAGKELVDSRHRIQNRDQIFQWYTLHKKLKAGQRIVQPGPFLPLTVVEVNSGVKNVHAITNGIDRQLLKQADEEMRSRRYGAAANLYRRCLNYIWNYCHEPRFGLIRCMLHQGDYKGALRSARDLLPTFVLNTDKGFEPDPNEWAWFLLVLLCCGKNREAALRAKQYPNVQNEELGRARRVVTMLLGDRCELATNTSHMKPRASIHQPPELTMDEWLEDVRHMLEACSQKKAARHLEKGCIDSSKRAGLVQTHLKRINQKLAKLVKRGPFGDGAFQQYLATRDRFSQFIGRNAKRAELLVRPLRKLPFGSPRISENEKSAIVGLLRKEEVTSATLIGAARNSWLSRAFMRGLCENPNAPSIECVNYKTPEFRKFHRKYVRWGNVKFRYLPDEVSASAISREKEGVVAINCAQVFSDARRAAASASVVLLDRINNEAGSELFQALLVDENYVLIAHEPAQNEGYAIFRRAALQAA